MPETKFVDIEIGGKTRQLRYDYNALVDVEQELGKPVSVWMNEEMMSGKVNLTTIRALLFHGLKHVEAKMPRAMRTTIEQVGEWMEFPKIQYYVNCIGEALGKAMKPYVPDEPQTGDQEGEAQSRQDS